MVKLSLEGDKIVYEEGATKLEVGSVDYDEEDGLAIVLLASPMFAEAVKALIETAYPEAEIEFEY